MRGKYVIVTKNKKGTVSISSFFDEHIWKSYWKLTKEHAEKNDFKNCYTYTSEVFPETID